MKTKFNKTTLWNSKTIVNLHRLLILMRLKLSQKPWKKRKQVRLKVKVKNFDDLIALGNKISSGLTGNPNFYQPSPAVKDLNEALQALQVTMDKYADKENKSPLLSAGFFVRMNHHVKTVMRMFF